MKIWLRILASALTFFAACAWLSGVLQAYEYRYNGPSAFSVVAAWGLAVVYEIGESFFVLVRRRWFNC